MQHISDVSINGSIKSCIFIQTTDMKHYDIAGQTYNNLLVLKHQGSKNGNSLWLCECLLCGNNTIVTRPNLRSGNTKDCGCQKNLKISGARSTHKLSKTPTYKSWLSMRKRIKEGAAHSKVYGTIDIDPKWQDFMAFYEDMGERPKKHSLDRIDNTKGYYKENCRWATQAMQNRNRSTNVLITYNGITKCMTDWSNELGIHRSVIRRRLDRNLPPELVLKKG